MPIHQKHIIFQMSLTQIEPKFYAQILCQYVVFFSTCPTFKFFFFKHWFLFWLCFAWECVKDKYYVVLFYEVCILV